MSKRLVITMSEELYNSVEESAKRLGVDTTEYVRFLILKAQEKISDRSDVEKSLGLL